MASNAGKRLEKLAKSLDAIATKNKRHHFVVVQPHQLTDGLVAEMYAQGIIREGDAIQPVTIAWTVSTLRGAAHIPEGSDADPYADPRTRGQEGPEPSSQGLDLPHPDRAQVWKDHERRIEMDGQRYKGE